MGYLVEHPQIILLSVIGLGVLGVLFWMYTDTRKEFRSNHLIDTLKEMHKQMLYLKNTQLSRKQLDMKQVELVTPVLMEKLELVKLGDWDKFKKNIAKQIRRHITERSKKKGDWYYKVAGVASEIKKDLVSSKNWKMADLDIVGEWLDGQHWGLEELRKDDKRWNKLYESIEPFTRDSKLRELISNHISLSYGSCSTLLIFGYSAKWQNNMFLTLLHATLVGSPISPIKIDLALSEILSDIDRRMEILKRRGKHK